MNLKERGITVGDLFIIIIIIITTSLVAKTFNKDKKTALSQINKDKIYYKQILLSKNNIKQLDCTIQRSIFL